jgi:hypothetical protein
LIPPETVLRLHSDSNLGPRLPPLTPRPSSPTPPPTPKGVEPGRVYIKIASTWEGVEACRRLQKQGIDCNMTLLFSFGQVGVVWLGVQRGGSGGRASTATWRYCSARRG